VESLVNKKLFNGNFEGKRVLVTGHTGFKGSWLVLWLKMLGADVIGYSLNPPSEPNHFSLLDLEIEHIIGDILDSNYLDKIIMGKSPDIVFHMAAQSLVRKSYSEPVLTYKTNVLGTLNVFEACRKSSSVKVIINITTDKCYENNEWVWGYRETDALGGYDPYSSSKACSEILTNSYRNSYFNLDDFNKHNVLLASVRAGNVIGGGDWATDRLIPDIMRAISMNKTVEIRNPKATRPWQHVLEPLSGYLMLASKLIERKKEFAESWNFGPKSEDAISVEKILKMVKRNWPALDYKIDMNNNHPHEAGYLKLDCSKANQILKWMPVWSNLKAIELTTKWYQNYYVNKQITSVENIYEYIDDAKEQEISWAL
jgi:CDP-glucose 4,6-dehydratase